MFCCQLEELIRWLYNVADITDSWVPAMPAAESVKASLHRYLVGIAAGFSSLSWVLWAASSTKQDTAGTVQVGDAGRIRCAKPNLGTCSGETAPRVTCCRRLFQKPILSSIPFLLPFPGVQERRG